MTVFSVNFSLLIVINSLATALKMIARCLKISKMVNYYILKIFVKFIK